MPIIWIWIAGLFILIFIAVFIFRSKPSQTSPLPTPSLSSSSTRPIIMMVIDSLMDAPLREAIQTGRAPAMKYLMEQGHYYPKLVTSFPTMSVCIDSTLLTGTPPNQHQIFGLTYFHPKQNRIINFGTGLRESIVFGIKNVLKDSLQLLNQQFLSKEVKTIHEEFEGTTAAINAIVYRGKRQTFLRSPWLAVLFGIIPRKIRTMAPDIFSFGALSKINPASGHDQAIFRYGINDRFSRMELVYLIEQNLLPPFTIAYLPSNDAPVHKKGASEIKGIIKVDQEIQAILHAFPSWKEAIQQATFIILGDSGQVTMIPDRKQAYIDLKKILSKYRIMPTKQKKPKPHDQLILCVNERMAYIYLMDEQISLSEIVQVLKQEQRLDVIAWKEDKEICVVSGVTEGELHYHSGGEFSDEYGQTWQLAGDISILDLIVTEEKQIQYNTFPDVLFRLENVMGTAERVVVTTCSPGYEIVGEGSPTHKGGSHGSLHQLESLVPMIVCGTDTQPDYLRFVDLKKWILGLMTPTSP